MGADVEQLMGVDFKRLASGERPEDGPAEPGSFEEARALARQVHAPGPVGSRLDAIAALTEGASTFEQLAEACDVNAKRLQDQADAGDQRTRDVARIRSDAEGMRKRAALYRDLARKHSNGLAYVLGKQV